MPDPKNLESVREYFRGRKEEIMKQYNAEGAGIGKAGAGDDRYAIVVYLKRKQDIPPEPVELDGIPVRFEVTGGFQLQQT
jgi:hypothetical protein